MDWKKNNQKNSTSVGCRSDSGPGACTCTCTAERTAPLRFHVVVYASGCCSFVVSLNQDATSGQQRGEELNHPRSPMYEHKNTLSPSSSSSKKSGKPAIPFVLYSTASDVEAFCHSATTPMQTNTVQFHVLLKFVCCSTSGWKQMLPGPFFLIYFKVQYCILFLRTDSSDLVLLISHNILSSLFIAFLLVDQKNN